MTWRERVSIEPVRTPLDEMIGLRPRNRRVYVFRRIPNDEYQWD